MNWQSRKKKYIFFQLHTCHNFEKHKNPISETWKDQTERSSYPQNVCRYTEHGDQFFSFFPKKDPISRLASEF